MEPMVVPLAEREAHGRNITQDAFHQQTTIVAHQQVAAGQDAGDWHRAHGVVSHPSLVTHRPHALGHVRHDWVRLDDEVWLAHIEQHLVGAEDLGLPQILVALPGRERMAPRHAIHDDWAARDASLFAQLTADERLINRRRPIECRFAGDYHIRLAAIEGAEVHLFLPRSKHIVHVGFRLEMPLPVGVERAVGYLQRWDSPGITTDPSPPSRRGPHKNARVAPPRNPPGGGVEEGASLTGGGCPPGISPTARSTPTG